MLKKTKREVLIILAKQINANTKMADFFKSGRLLTKKTADSLQKTADSLQKQQNI